MSDIKLDLNYSGISDEELNLMAPSASAAKEALLSGNGKGSDFLGWVNLPRDYDREEFQKIKDVAQKIRKESDVLVVIGIGGSYLGSRAAIEFMMPKEKKADTPDIYFAGNSLSIDSIHKTITDIGDRDFSINVISKSGTTTETAIAFRIFKKLLEAKYGKEGAANRIYATTDAKVGALKTMANINGYETFVVPDDIGGRYSVLTAVGLLPIAVAGVDIDELMQGAENMRGICMNKEFKENPSLIYAALRHNMVLKGKTVEILCNFNMALHSLAEWWKQLFGESEGKDGKGLFPASVDYSTDLHSMGQFIQDGSRVMFETMLFVENSNSSMIVEPDDDDLDGLNYLNNRSLDFINKCAMQGTAEAHFKGGTPNSCISFSKKTAHTLGELFYFFEFACGVSGYMLGVNPFNQPGVEHYKKNMFKRLGKPGY